MTKFNEITEAIAIIAHMNDIISEGCGDQDYLQLVTDGDGFEISYLGNAIFNSENDYVEDDQPLEMYLWTEIKEMMENFGQMYELAKSKSNGQ